MSFGLKNIEERARVIFKNDGRVTILRAVLESDRIRILFENNTTMSIIMSLSKNIDEPWEYFFRRVFDSACENRWENYEYIDVRKSDIPETEFINAIEYKNNKFSVNK